MSLLLMNMYKFVVISIWSCSLKSIQYVFNKKFKGCINSRQTAINDFYSIKYYRFNYLESSEVYFRVLKFKYTTIDIFYIFKRAFSGKRRLSR